MLLWWPKYRLARWIGNPLYMQAPEAYRKAGLGYGPRRGAFNSLSELDLVLGGDPESERWRSEYLYSRAASIYGGSAEIQRNIIARRLLDLGKE